ncbi:MAG: DUF1294 domain-containing protein [Marinomonas sp.]
MFIFVLLFSFYGLMGLVTFCFYCVDKSAAKHGRQRVRESTLHWLSFFGGWCGALLGQRVFRHKTKKRRFRFVFWVTVILNVMILSYGVYFMSGF